MGLEKNKENKSGRMENEWKYFERYRRKKNSNTKKYDGKW